MTSPTLWYINRGSGLVLLVLFTAVAALGVATTAAQASGVGEPRKRPAFVTLSLHRSLSLLAAILMLLHAVTAVVDEFVDIRWWQAVLPIPGAYKPVYLALGTFALDLTVAITLTSLFRDRINPRLWRFVHWLAYLGWVVAVVHAWGIGTDMKFAFGQWTVYGCVGAMALVVLRRVYLHRRWERKHRAPVMVEQIT